MRLYHSRLVLILLIAMFFLPACDGNTTPTQLIHLTIVADGEENSYELSAGSTVGLALRSAGIELNDLDRVSPDELSLISEAMQIQVVRVREEFEIEEVTIPFEQQMQPSELLSEGEMQPLQLGENGLQEITYRRLFEDGVEVSRNPIKSVVVNEPVSQIMLVGIQSAFFPQDIDGRLVYLSDGNAWYMDDSTANRVPIISTGDLDGRVFSLSDDRRWLLFTRRSEDEDEINTLWAVNVEEPDVIVDLDVANIIHFADWRPRSSSAIAFSTVEPRITAPGWQANNDLYTRNFSSNGWVERTQTIQETFFGGVYGWWGTDFEYSPDGVKIAYASPDEIGYRDLQSDEQIQLMDIIPFQTVGDWAWVPGFDWSVDDNFIYFVEHVATDGIDNPEASTRFDLSAIPVAGGNSIRIIQDVGMFAYPTISPFFREVTGDLSYRIAYLQAISPMQSDTSRYTVMTVDRDGSNRKQLFPDPGLPGIEAQSGWGAWAPFDYESSSDLILAIIYQGNIWFIDPESGESWQITGDGRVNRIDWK